MDFKRMFQHEGGHEQDAFLSRLFGIFSEDIVSIWAKHKNSPYRNTGRPYVQTLDERVNKQRGCVFDFTLEEKRTSRFFVCEQKCELEYQNYKFLELTGPEQLKHHENADTKRRNRGFTRFRDIANNPQRYITTVDGNPIKISGIILIWGKISERGRTRVKNEYNMHDVLSLEKIINQLISWKSDKYFEFIKKTQKWSNDLFENLKHT